MRFFFSCFTLLNGLTLIGQHDAATNYYTKGLDFFNQMEYARADSAFRKSKEIEPSKEVYNAIALCNKKLGKIASYCESLAQASHLGDEKATAQFRMSCGRIDTTFPRIAQNFSKTPILSRVITYHVDSTKVLPFKQNYFSQDVFPTKSKDNTAPTEATVEVEAQAEFPGGVDGLMRFIKKNLIVPRSFNGMKEKAFLKFTVFEDGSIHEIEVIKGVPDCPACDEEATRLVAMMPRWSPARTSKRPVKCYFTLPISFSSADR